MAGSEDGVAAYKERLVEVYRPELDSLAERLGVRGDIVNTGGGCMAIEAIVGKVPGTNHPLDLLITTVDAGLASDRDQILHWYACLYDAEDGGDALAEGHDLESFGVACDLALDNLRHGVPPSDEVCTCLLVTGVDD